MNDMNDIKRNGDGYVDLTAFLAMKEVITEEKRMEIYKGDIFEVKLTNNKIREVVVLAVHNQYSSVLMLQDDISLPIKVNSRSNMYTDPAMVQYMFNHQFTTFIRSLKEAEVDEIIELVVQTLGYNAPQTRSEPNLATKEVKVVEIPTEDKTELIKAQTERDIYKQLYTDLLAKVTD